MKIFVGFGFNAADKWIEEMVVPIIQSFDGDVITGGNIEGNVLTDGVKNRINECDALFAFFTPVLKTESGKYTTHDWVRDEYNYAIGIKKEAIAVIDSVVVWNSGLTGDRQIIQYNQNEKDRLFVRLSEILSKWRQYYTSQRIRLITHEMANEIKPLISKGVVKCSYRYMIGSWESPEIPASLIRIAGAVCIDIKNIPEANAMVQIKVIADGMVWISDYESLEFLSINLSKE